MNEWWLGLLFGAGVVIGVGVVLGREAADICCLTFSGVGLLAEMFLDRR